MIEFIRDFVHGGSVVFIGIIIMLGAAALIRPQLFKKFFHEFTERKYIVVVSVFLCLLSGTIFVATQPPDDNFAAEQTVPTQQTVKPMNADSTPAEPPTNPGSQSAGPGTESAPLDGRKSAMPVSSPQAPEPGNQASPAPAGVSNPSANEVSQASPAEANPKVAQPQPEKKCTQILIVCL
jgi:hypothetical protein